MTEENPWTLVYGKHSQAVIYTDDVENEAKAQVQDFCDSFISENANPRLMPDIHAGAGCTVGFTALLTDFVVPNMIGGDIGCGVLGSEIGYQIDDVDDFFAHLDAFIRKYIPSGFNRHSKCAFSQCELKQLYEHSSLAADMNLTQYLKALQESGDRVESTPLNSLGTLGGGNHFIEVDRDQNGRLWVVIHTGSRNYGLQVVKFYNRLTQIRVYDFQKAFDQIESNGKVEIEVAQVAEFKNFVIETLKRQKREKTIPYVLEKIVPYHRRSDLAFLIGKNREGYIWDMKVAQTFAYMNRRAILMRINQFIERYAAEKGLKTLESPKIVESIHNYIDFKDNVIRKGAISARAGDQVIIPLNMRDGTVIGVGKGNEAWNWSAPHGAGRRMSRTRAKKELTIDGYKTEMAGVWSTSISIDTIDEAPDAYKSSAKIIEYLRDTVEVTHRMQSVYNFKAGKDERQG